MKILCSEAKIANEEICFVIPLQGLRVCLEYFLVKTKVSIRCRILQTVINLHYFRATEHFQRNFAAMQRALSKKRLSSFVRSVKLVFNCFAKASRRRTEQKDNLFIFRYEIYAACILCSTFWLPAVWTLHELAFPYNFSTSLERSFEELTGRKTRSNKQVSVNN